MNLKDAVNYEYSEQDMIKPLKNITLSEADSTETFNFKPFEYERGTVTKTTKGVINTIRDMQDIPEQVKIFGKRISFGFGGYFGDTEEETERKKLNLVTAERNLNEAQAERYKYTSPKETESLSYGIGGGVVNYGTMLVPAGLVGGGLKAAGAGAKAISTGAEIAGLGTMSVMELAGQVQDKTPEKDGKIDIEAMTPEWARKATGGTIAYTGLSALTEKYVGFGKQMKMWNKPIQWGGNVTSKALTTLRTAGTNALSEGATEGIQDLEATGIGLIDGTLTMDKLPARLQQAWKSAIIGGIIGGGVGTAAAMKSARNVKKQLREMVAPVVGEQDANTVAEAIYNAGTDDMTKAMSIELELSSELKNKHGKVWNSMLTAVTKEMEGKPRFEGWSEDQKAHYANTVAKHFADQTLAEANFRGTTLDAILRASDITWNKGIRLARHINLFDALKNPEMIPPETKLKRESLLAFLKRNGGLQDYGGELKSRDAQKLYPGIVNKNGMNFDDAALMAWENGYFPSKTERPDINEFLEAVDEGLRGNYRYNTEEERNFSDAIEDLREELDRLGIDYENMTAAEIEKAVDEIPEMKSLEREAAFYEQYEPEIGLSEDEAERFAMETEGKQYPVIKDKDLPEYYQIADENAQNRGTYSESENIYHQTAFAGSRTDYDEPSLEAIGTGEGAQAHGWGLYYALSKEVAEKYRQTFSRQSGYKYNGKELKYLQFGKYNAASGKRRVLQDIIVKSTGQETKEEFADIVKELKDKYQQNIEDSKSYDSDFWQRERKIAEENLKGIEQIDFSKLEKVNKGQVHEVDLPENPYLLDEQKMLGEQSPLVKKALREVAKQVGVKWDNRYDNGKYIYDNIANVLGSPKAASQLLEKYGIKGITYDGKQDGRCFVIFNPKDVKVIQKFYQRGKNAQGSTKITPDEYIIKLLESADESTLPHEFAHYWLTEMWNYTRTGRASENYMKRWNIISDYLGVRPEQTRLTPTQQEKFASSYEAYLTRGELPTPLIGSVFDDYDKWLQQVYKDYNSINYHVKKGKKVYSHPVRLTDAAIKFFQSMTTGTLEAPALAPKNTGVAIPEKTEEVIKPTNEVVETPATYDTTRVINITEGKKGVSKVYQREAMKHADRIVDELGVSYNKINLEEQAVKASEWVQNNLDEARKVVNGAPAPEGIIDTAIFIAYENEMLRIGNNAEYQRALKIHSQVQTQRGQAIAAERITTDDVNNPAYWWKKLQKSQETNVARKLFKGDTDALNQVVETETKNLMKQIAGKPRDEQVKALSNLAKKLQKDYNLDTLYQMPDEVNEKTVKEFVKDVFGINPDLITGNEVINKAEQLQKLWDNTKDDSGNPSVEAMRAKRELNDLIQTRNPSSTLAIWTSIFGRGVMLMSVKSPILNVISNIEAGLTEGITRRIMYKTTEKAVDANVKKEFSDYAWEVYKASGDIVSTMNNYDDDMRVIGEQILHSQGQGALRAASRKVEEVSFKYLMGAPDAWFKRLAFNDTADLLATKIAREEGAKDISKRATEIYKDAILIKPQTEQGQLVRQKAQEQAHYTTFTNDSWAAKFGLSARNWLNMVGRNKVRLGDLTMKFVKTPANVQMMGLEYGFGSLYTLYNIQEVIKNPQSEVSQHAIRAAVRNGLGIALAALLYSMLDPEDYFSEFDTLNPKEKDKMRALGALPNSIKIGNRWVSLDYFGQIAIPLVGMLEARRNDGLRSYIQSGLTQAAKIPGIKETKQLIDTMSEYARYDLKPEKIVQMMAGTVLDQARVMTIPAIVNDIAKMTDDYERDTMGGVFDKVFASIPGLRQTLPERYGVQGIVETEPALSTLLFGSRVKTAQDNKLVREINKLSTKDEQPSISDVTKYGDLRLLSAEKKVRVRKEFYKLYNSESKKLISTRAYKEKTPEEQKKALNKVRSRVVKSLKEKYSNDIQREKRRQ